MLEATSDLTTDRPHPRGAWVRAILVASLLAAIALAGSAAHTAMADPGVDGAAAADAATDAVDNGARVPTLRVHGYPVVSNPAGPPEANRPATAGSNTAVDPLTGQLPEDPPYTTVDGPFDPLSFQAPEMDFVTWNPAWISERLGDTGLIAEWPGLRGMDEVSAGSHIRASSLDASEKVWLRHWYEPQHLDKDLNADGRLTDDDPFDGRPDAPVNPTPSNTDEWYPAVMTELTYMLIDNDPLPERYPLPSELHHSAPRAVCGTAGRTQMVFPVGVSEDQTDPAGDLEGFGLTSLDVDFDGLIDMVNVSDEETLAGEIGAVVDFDGDGLIDALDPDGQALSCDEMVVMHTDTMLIELGEQVQFLDHFVKLVGVTDSAAVLEVYYNGDLRPRLIQQRLVGSGATILAGDSGPVHVLPPGGDNLGVMPPGPWFAHLVDVDLGDNTALLSMGRALGAPCAAMEAAPNAPNRTPGGPWFLKRLYVDGHEYNVVAIYTCGTDEFQYITLRAPLPKVPVTIEQHSVRLQPYGLADALALPPPFNYEHTILEDVVALQGFDSIVPDEDFPLPTIRPSIHYMGGPIGPVPPILGAGDDLPYVGRDPSNPIDPPYADRAAMRWLYVDEDVDPQMLGQIKEKMGAETPGVVVGRCDNCPVPIPQLGTTAGITISPSDFVAACGPNGTILDVDVSIDITHGDLGQLDMIVASPGLTLVPVYDQVCAGSTAMQTVFDDEAPAAMTPGDCPPVGYTAYQPAPGALTSFDGENGFGLWMLTVLDSGAGATGTLQDWSLSIRCQGPGTPAPADTFFYNEQAWSLPWHYTEFLLPDLPLRYGGPLQGFDADKVHVTTAFTDWIARWRRWRMPDEGVPSTVPPIPPDLVANFTPDAFPPPFGFPLGMPRRAAFWFDPDVGGKLFADSEGVKLYGGLPENVARGCDPRRPSQALSAGDMSRRLELDTGYPVEVLPYTDPWAPFNSQHLHAPRADSLTFNPAYMDEFRNYDEDLRLLYTQLSNDAQNAREKVYHRLWYEPEYITKARYIDDCERDLRFPAVVQEYTYLYMDTTDNPTAVPAGSSRFGFPIGTTARQLPAPVSGTTVLPPGGEFGYGLTTFDADFDGYPDAVTVHSEQTLASFMAVQWQTNRPSIPGFPLPAVPGAELDFDGDGQLDDLDTDGVPLSGDELVVFAVESITLDLDQSTPMGSSAMLLDHLVSLENVTPGSNAQFRVWYAGGNGADARPEPVGGLRVLEIGDAALVDRFQNKVSVISPAVAPDNRNDGTDGAWFVFLEDVATSSERVVITVGRALGATHSAIDNGAGGHDLEPGDPWYLKRFYVDGQEYNTVALMTLERDALDREEDPAYDFQFITIRTPVPKGNFVNPQDTLFQQGYYFDRLPDVMPVLPPFNTDHTIAVDIDRLDEAAFANSREYDACVGDLAPAGRLVERIRDEDVERRFGVELRELLDVVPDDPGSDQPFGPGDFTWEVDQLLTTPYQFTEVSVPDGQKYLVTLNWTSRVSRLHYYGCSRQDAGPFPDGVPGLTHFELADLADGWSPPPNVVPAPNQLNPAQPLWPLPLPGQPPIMSPYFDARLGGPQVRVKLFYDPNDARDPYVGWLNLGGVVTPGVPAEPTDVPPEPTDVPPRPTDAPPVAPSATPVPPPVPGTLCIDGRIYLQGRSEHDGASVSVDGIELAETERDGTFSVCIPSETYDGSADEAGQADDADAEAREVTVRVSHACYLDRVASVVLSDGAAAELPYSALVGGDVNDDSSVNLYDLVRIGAQFGVEPLTDDAADCTGDGLVNLFDLVMVGSNYLETGPLDWHEGRMVEMSEDGQAPAAWSGAHLEARVEETGELVVDIVAHEMSELYAAELRLDYDPDRLRVVDASDRAGVQIALGPAWGGDGEYFVAANAADDEEGEIVFAASRMNPAPAMSGELVLATVTFEVLDGNADGAYGLSSALLLGTAGDIPARWDVADIYPLDPTALPNRVFMPVAGVERGSH